MQEIIPHDSFTEEEEFRQFQKLKKLESTKGSIGRMEYDYLSVFADKAELKEICRKANGMELGAIIVFPTFVEACVGYLGRDPKTSLIAAISYPYGEEVIPVKALAVKRAVKNGVDEVEVSAPTAFIKAGNFAYFKKEVKKLKKASGCRALRIVLDCAMLTERELLKASQVAVDAGANCLRLSNADSDTVCKVRAALKGKGLIKADGATSEEALENFCTMGADYVGCRRACDLATYMLKKAEES